MTDSSPEHRNSGEAASNTQKASPGSMLQAAREAAGLSREELSQRLCIIDNTVEWLETDNYARQPDVVYARGYIRNTCRELKIPSEPVLKAYDRDRPQPSKRAESRRMGKAEAFNPDRKRGHGFLALIPLLLAGGVFWWKYGTPVNIPGVPVIEEAVEGVVQTPTAQASTTLAVAGVSEGERGDETGPQSANSAIAQVPEPGSKTIETASSVQEVRNAGTEKPISSEVADLDQALQGALRLRFDEDAWIEVKDAQGVVLLAGVQAAGSSKALEGRAPFELMLGNAEATHVVYREETIDSQPIGDRRTRRLIVGD
ncbi:DUF4115 domain-containing protein [Microbulbifer sp. OS29]|uniref:DUF4115 domain-containing protein n=1 Tax=Microbulbifer okhotskensis TaxID=2926617 RepID=A0A9X2EKE0_9GAMM|nr:RodZ domain-containing protein [Microbulbifer okhotskensis]MCO1333832.1 DUF4115 domain-containing protein [Microbulbifer okhotskensis]